MKKQRRFFICLLCLTVFSVAVLAGCGNGTVENPPLPSQTPAETQAPVETPAPVETEPPASAFLAAGSREEIKEGLIEAVGQFRPELVVDFSGAGLENPEMDVRNLYYEMSAQQPELKYVYDLEIQVDGSQLVCTFHYMPYKTGDFPEGFAGQEAGSIPELIALAEENIGQEAVPVRITNRELDPDSMNRALQQAGGGYLLCMLNRDATAIQYQTSFGTDMETGLAALAEADRLAEQVIAQVVTPGMSQREKAEALYAYVTSMVSYDQRYYTDRNKMPYESQTALGALRDGVAICGGYSHTVKLLFEKVGIPCFNVAGKYFSENHMWNIALLDGQWLWFDATADRGSTGEFGFLRFGLTELDSTKYSWDWEQIQWLIG